MPIVIDANAANSLACGGCESSKAILGWIRTQGSVTSGGQLQLELVRTQLRPLLAQWASAGKLFILPATDVARAQAIVHPDCISNDSHVVAVLKLSGAKILVTGDQNLKADAKNKDLIPQACKVISCDQGHFSRVRIVRPLLAKFG